MSSDHELIFEIDSNGHIHILRGSITNKLGWICSEILMDLVCSAPEAFCGRFGAIHFGSRPPVESWRKSFELRFSTTTLAGSNSLILPFPCPHSLRLPYSGDESSEDLFEEILTDTQPIRDPRAFWSGGYTHWSRRALLQKSLYYPGILAVTLAEEERSIRADFITSDGNRSLLDCRNYKYLIDCQGAGYSPKLKFLLACGRAVFITERRPVENWHQMLVPWKHYIPVRADFGDLVDHYNLLEGDTDLYNQICSNARRFAKEELSLESQMITTIEAVMSAPRHDASPDIKRSGNDFALVIARYNEELSWIDEVAEDVDIYIINKGEQIDVNRFERDNIKVIPRENVGREADTYLFFIEARLFAGYEWVIFTQGDPFPHSPDFLSLLEFRREWKDFQPLSCCWFQYPPKEFLVAEQSEFINGCMVRSETVSLHTMNIIKYHDEGSVSMADLYREIHGLEEGANIAEHFFRMIGMDEIASDASKCDVGIFNFGAIFAIRTAKLHHISPIRILKARRMSQAHFIHGYIFERMWHHFFGVPFLHSHFDLQ